MSPRSFSSPLRSLALVASLVGCATRGDVASDDPSAPAATRATIGPAARDAQEGASESGVVLVPRVAYWRPSLDGHFLVTKASQPGSGSRIDADQLGLDPANAWSAGFDLLLHDHRFQFSYDRIPVHGSATIDQPFVYHGAEFAAGTQVSSELTFDLWRATYDYPVWQDDLVDLRLGGGVCFLQFSTELGGDQGVEKRSFNQLLPALTADVEVTPYPWRIGAAALFGLSGNDRELIDVDAHAGVWLARAITLDLGYRWMIVDLTEGTNDADLMLSGPRVSLSIRF